MMMIVRLRKYRLSDLVLWILLPSLARSFVHHAAFTFQQRTKTAATAAALGARANNNSLQSYTSLNDFLEAQNISSAVKSAVFAISEACVEISPRLARLPLLESNVIQLVGGNINVQGETQTGMDVLCNTIMIQKLRPLVAAMASEEEDFAITGQGDSTACRSSQLLEVAFDPLDGSSNVDITPPTGTIFSIAPHDTSAPFSTSGRSLLAAGYAVYSASTELVIAFKTAKNDNSGNTTTSSVVHGFTLCEGTFYLSRQNITCPDRGPYYSLNEAREPDWPLGLKRWVHDAKRGLTPSGTKYSARYICSLCADVHRSLLKGGWAGDPRPHLRLLFEAAPMSFILEAAGGKGSNGVRNLLDLVPSSGQLHERVCVFVGSKLDVEDLESYGDVQQKSVQYKQ